MWSKREFRRGGRQWGERFFEKGDLKYVLLELLKDKPSHGYELIRALEERFSGYYAPSPGAVYPTLQMLEDMGYVSVAEQDGKKVYTVTDAGHAFLAERRPVVEEIWGRMRDRWDPEFSRDVHRVMHDLRDEVREFARMFAGEARKRWPDADQGRRIREVLSKARHDVEAILREEKAPSGGPTRV
jgi:DNA-binding PadR family transcriptional regulator